MFDLAGETVLSEVSYKSCKAFAEVFTDVEPFVAELVAESAVMQDLVEVIKEASLSSSYVLLTGEIGSGKSFLAKIIHSFSERSEKCFVEVDAKRIDRSGGKGDESIASLVGLASGGTLYIKNVFALSLGAQKSLLDFLEKDMSSSVRIVASSSVRLNEEVGAGRFLEALYFRLNVLPFRVPPLRVRKEDILLLAEKFLERFSQRYGKNFTAFSPDAIMLMEGYLWQGNILELELVVERAVLTAAQSIIMLSDLRLGTTYMDESEEFASAVKDIASVLEKRGRNERFLRSAVNYFKKVYITNVLEKHRWNQTQASKELGVQRSYLNRLMKTLVLKER